MIRATTFAFLRELADNDTREWFEDHRADYDTVMDNLAETAETIIARVDESEKGFAAANPDPRAAISRIHRDMRFAKPGKSKFKPDFFVSFHPTTASAGIAGYYLHIEPGNVYAGGGSFTPDPASLGRIRTRMSASYSRWTAVAESTEMTAMFPHGLTAPETLKIAPQGFDPADPAIEYLRMKGYCANRPLTMKRIQAQESVGDVVETFATVRPLVEYLNDAAQ
jgi:uncharacterized protein (TIGR02453 family)